MCRIDLCGQIGVWAQKIYESDFMKMRSLKLHLGAIEDNTKMQIKHKSKVIYISIILDYQEYPLYPKRL